MAQINAFNFQQTPQNLAAINNVRPSYMPEVWDWQQRAQQQDQTGLADLMRAAQHEQTMDPIRVQQGQATLADTQAGTAGKLLNNEAQRMKNEVDAYVLPQAKLQAAKDLILKGSEADEKMFAIEVDKMLRSNDPKQRAYGEQLLNTSRKAIEEKRKAALEWENKQRELRITEGGANARLNARLAHEKKLEEARIAAGKYDRKSTAVTVQDRLLKAKTSLEKAEILEAAYYLATAAEDKEAAAIYQSRAIDARKRAAEDAANRGAAGQAGKLDTVEMLRGNEPTGMPAPAAAAPIAGPVNPAVADRPARQASTQRITIYKDGKAIGTVPLEQKEQAIKEGYTVK